MLNICLPKSKLSYEDKLKQIGLTTLKERRLRGDLIQLFKVLKGYDKVNWYAGPKQSSTLNFDGPVSNLRGHNLKLDRESFPSANANDFAHFVTLRHNFFTNRVVPYWNSLTDDVVKAKTVNSFKAKLDEWFNNNDLAAIAL